MPVPSTSAAAPETDAVSLPSSQRSPRVPDPDDISQCATERCDDVAIYCDQKTNKQVSYSTRIREATTDSQFHAVSQWTRSVHRVSGFSCRERENTGRVRERANDGDLAQTGISARNSSELEIRYACTSFLSPRDPRFHSLHHATPTAVHRY